MTVTLDQVREEERLPVVDPLCGEAADPIEERRNSGFRILRCRRCGLAWSDPHVTDEALAHLVYTDAYVADAWKQPRRRSLASRLCRVLRGLVVPVGHVEKRWAFVRRWLPVSEPLEVLEVGCWTGELMACAGERAPGWRLTGIDVSPFAVEQARKLGLDVREAALESAGFAEHVFDGLIAWNVLEHSRDPLVFLAQARRVLRPAGRCILHLPNYGGAQSRYRGSQWSELLPEQHRWHFTLSALTRLLTTAGADILHLGSPPWNQGTQTYAVVKWPQRKPTP